MIIRKLVLTALLGLFSSASFAEAFKVEDIQVKGLQRVALGAALTHIPFNVGDNLNDFRISQSIRSLFKSGHFNNISVSRDGNRVIFTVQERQTISDIEYDGNKDIKDEQLLESLDENNIRVGETLDRTVLTNLELGLEDFYYSVGKYNANVSSEIIYLPRNRVSIKINFNEGDAAAIEQINIVGNEVFSDETLLSRIELKFDSPWWNLFAQDRYQKQTLQGDKETIESYYLDRGYLRYKVDSTQVSVTPNKEGVYVTLNVSEGDTYNVSEVDFVGDMAGFEPIIRSLNPIRKDTLYNGALVTFTEESISRFLGRYGYAYPTVTTIPEINDEDNTVKLTISVNPGKRIYVNRINIAGNTVTSEEVFRREFRQFEGAWLSNSLVERSKTRLQRLPYVASVDFETKQLPESDDLVDIDFDIAEQSSGSFNAGIGFGSTTKISLNAGIQQNNFLGTGNQLAFNINTVSFSQSVTLSYTDPFFTVDGVSLGGNLNFTEFDAGSANLTQFNNQSYGAGLTWGFPINETTRITIGGAYRHSGISQIRTYEQIQPFFDTFSELQNNDTGLEFDNFEFNLGISRSTLNRGTFPTSGSRQSLAFKITTPNSDLQYFTVDLDAKWYFPLTKSQRWTVLARLEGGYGNGYGTFQGNDQVLPFFENFRAGGNDSLRGFETNIIGPRPIFRTASLIEGVSNPLETGSVVAAGIDQDLIEPTDNLRSVGGNAKLLGGVELIFPVPFLPEGFENSVRTSVFLDVGNVWDTEFDLDDFRDLAEDQFNLIDDYSDIGRYRSSVGLSVQWLSPMGPLLFSFAKPLKKEDSDDTSFFSFNIGSTF